MRDTELSPPEQRVLGCLLEKRFTTPDQYPLSLNSLRLACNQATNRNPVTDYDEATVREAAQRLCKRGLARLVSGHTSRTVKYRHLAEEALQLEKPELSLLTVLLLRGAQTPGELKGRTERMVQFGSLAEVEGLLGALGERDFIRRVPRRPGQKEDRFEHLLGEESPSAEGPASPGDAAVAAYPSPGIAHDAAHAGDGPRTDVSGMGAERPPLVPVGAPGSTHAEPIRAMSVGAGQDDSLAARVEALEAQVAALREQVEALRDARAD